MLKHYRERVCVRGQDTESKPYEGWNRGHLELWDETEASSRPGITPQSVVKWCMHGMETSV